MQKGGLTQAFMRLLIDWGEAFSRRPSRGGSARLVPFGERGALCEKPRGADGVPLAPRGAEETPASPRAVLRRCISRDPAPQRPSAA